MTNKKSRRSKRPRSSRSRLSFSHSQRIITDVVRGGYDYYSDTSSSFTFHEVDFGPGSFGSRFTGLCDLYALWRPCKARIHIVVAPGSNATASLVPVTTLVGYTPAPSDEFTAFASADAIEQCSVFQWKTGAVGYSIDISLRASELMGSDPSKWLYTNNETLSQRVAGTFTLADFSSATLTTAAKISVSFEVLVQLTSPLSTVSLPLIDWEAYYASLQKDRFGKPTCRLNPSPTSMVGMVARLSGFSLEPCKLLRETPDEKKNIGKRGCTLSDNNPDDDSYSIVGSNDGASVGGRVFKRPPTGKSARL